MVNIDGFSKSSLELINSMLYAEGQVNPLLGQCDQKKKAEHAKKPRTPAQQEADRARSQANRGQDSVPSARRSEAAKKAAQTRSRCAGTQQGKTK